MKLLECPQVDIAEYIAEIVEDRQAGANANYFTGIDMEWRERCQTYHQFHGDCAQIPVWQSATDHRKMFINLYSHPIEGAVQDVHIKRLRNRTLQFCPFCGEAGTPNTLDHYLPKDIFPHFSVLPQNLIPACDICQGEKKTEYQTQGNRRFAHLYYDEFLSAQLLKLILNGPYDAPVMEIQCHPEVPDECRSLLERHIEGIGLDGRYRKFFRTEYGRLVRLAGKSRSKGAAVARDVETLRDHAADRSLSCWEHILYDGALSNAELMEYLQNGELPEFL